MVEATLSIAIPSSSIEPSPSAVEAYSHARPWPSSTLTRRGAVL